jgi:hypothetical protein
MPLSPQQRRRVVDAIDAGQLRLDRPQKIYAGYGDGTACSACGEVIDKSQVEWEATYQDGQAYRMHLGCAGLWEAERTRRRRQQSGTEDARHTGEESKTTREQATATPKESAQLRDQADVLAREAETGIEKARRLKRGEQPSA